MGRKPGTAGGDNKERASRTDRNVFQRIGSTPVRNMEWLLQFNEQALDRLSPEEWKYLQEEILAFSLLGLLRFRGRGRYPSTDEVRRFAEVPFRTRTSQEFLKNLAQEMQDRSRRAISEFLSQGAIVLPRTPSREIVRMPFGVFEIPQQPDDPVSFFLEHLIGLLLDVGSRLLACGAPDCQRTAFVQTRRNQRFCSHTCRSRIAIREWRDRKHREKDKKKGRRASAKGGSRHGTKKR